MHFSIANPITIRLNSVALNQNENLIEESLSPERGVNIEGLFNSAFIRLNFCFKLQMDVHLREQTWPDGNYSIFGTEDGCPEGKD